MGKDLKVSCRVVYGKHRYYPENDVAEGFAKLMKQKSFFKDDLKQITKLGHKVEIISVMLPEEDETDTKEDFSAEPATGHQDNQDL